MRAAAFKEEFRGTCGQFGTATSRPRWCELLLISQPSPSPSRRRPNTPKSFTPPSVLTPLSLFRPGCLELFVCVQEENWFRNCRELVYPPPPSKSSTSLCFQPPPLPPSRQPVCTSGRPRPRRASDEKVEVRILRLGPEKERNSLMDNVLVPALTERSAISALDTASLVLVGTGQSAEITGTSNNPKDVAVHSGPYVSGAVRVKQYLRDWWARNTDYCADDNTGLDLSRV